MIYLNKIPLLKTLVKRQIYHNNNKNNTNTFLLYTKSINDSINILNSNKNLIRNNYSKRYYIPATYKGKIGDKRYSFVSTKFRKDAYEDIKKQTNMVPILNLDTPDVNIFFDMFKYHYYYTTLIMNKNIMKDRISEFWRMISEVSSTVRNPILIINTKLFNADDYKKNIDRLLDPAFMIYNTLYKFPNIVRDLDLDIILYNDNSTLKLNFKEMADTKTKFADFKLQYNILMKYSEKIISADNIEKIIDQIDKSSDENILTDITQDINMTNMKQKMRNNFVGDADSAENEEINDIEDEVEIDVNYDAPSSDEVDVVDDDDVPIETEDLAEVIDDEIIDQIDQTDLDSLYNAVKRNNEVKKSDANKKRDEELRKAQYNIKINGKTIEELLKVKPSDIKIKANDISSSIKTTNKNMNIVKFANYQKQYYEEVMTSDIAKSIMDLNNKSIPLYVRNVTINDSSDKLNYKDTYKIELEDTNRKRHTITVDIPKLVDNKFLLIGGNKKQINNQLFFLPIVKVNYNEVQIISNYFKLFIRRSENKSFSYIEKLVKFINSDEKYSKYCKFGSAYTNNLKNKAFMDMVELSRYIIMYHKDADNSFSLSMDYILSENPNALKDGKINIGKLNGKPMIFDMLTGLNEKGVKLSDVILDSLLSEEEQILYNKTSVGKSRMYSNVTIMNKTIPLVVLLMYWEGISELLKKSKIEYELLDKKPTNIQRGYDGISFSNMYLLYKDTPESSMLLNGIRNIDTSKYSYEDFDNVDVYMDYFKKVYGKAIILNALTNIYEFMIDPITLEILQTLKLPEDIVNIMVYGSNLLVDNIFEPDIKQTNYRIRSTEIIPAILHKELANQYIIYKNSLGKKKMSLRQDIVIGKLTGLKTVEEYSHTNPISEMTKLRSVSTKGYVGVNLDEAYTPAKRVYSDDSLGIISITSSHDGNVGVSKILTLEPSITNMRGFCDIADSDDKVEKLTDANLFNPSELAYPIGVTHDDTIRTSMASKQTAAMLATKKTSPVLISNGIEEVVKYNVSSDFAVVADDGGTVVERDEKTNLMVVKYNNGKFRAIDLAGTIVKNGGGGMYLSSKLISTLKVGDKVKKNDILAYHENYFTNNSTHGCRCNVGSFLKIAIGSYYSLYEDGCVITKKASQDMAADIVYKCPASIGKNSNIESMVKVGDKVDIGDTLISYDTSFEDSSMNTLLKIMSDDLNEQILENSRNNVKSKYEGTVEKIEIFSTVELSEMSDSLKNIVSKYYADVKKRESLLNKYKNDDDGGLVKCGMVFDATTDKTSPNKFGVIKGEKVEDGVLIIFYIKHEDVMGKGDKQAIFAALKGVVCDVIDEGEEMFSLYDPEEEISELVAPLAILKRMVPSITLTIAGNKVIVYLKRKLEEIYKKNKDRKAMESLVYRTYKVFDPSNRNYDKYHNIFSKMNDTAFFSYFQKLFNSDDYLVCDFVDYENEISMENIEKALDVMGVPLYEYVAMPHLSVDKNKPVITPEKILVGFVHIKRTQQFLYKKNGLSISSDKRSALTNQVTGKDKNGRESDMENAMLLASGCNRILRELNGFRADDTVAKNQAIESIYKKGYINIDELDNDVFNKTTLNTVDAYFLGMGLKTDLVTPGLMTKKTIKRGGKL